jgi:hypothetical protein
MMRPSPTNWCAMKYDASTIKTSGYWTLGLGLFGLIIYHVRVVFQSYPLDMGILTSTTAMTILGLVSIWVGGCLKRMENKLAEIERTRS